MATAKSPRRSLPARLLAALLNLAVVVAILASLAWIVPSLYGYERYVITGGSMSGSIEKGSVVFSRPTPVSDLVVGDVITYLPPPDSGITTLVTHRITAVKADADGVLSLRTRGDANETVDPWRFSLTGDLQPVVAFHVPLVGHLLTAVADRETRMLVIGLPATLVALVALGQLLSGLRSPRRTGTAPGLAHELPAVATRSLSAGA